MWHLSLHARGHLPFYHDGVTLIFRKNFLIESRNPIRGRLLNTKNLMSA